MRNAIVATCVLIPLTVMPVLVLAQVTVRGKVVDETGVGVAGARVELRIVERSVAVSVVSGNTGTFAVELKWAGFYEARAEHPGFFLLSGKQVDLRDGANELTLVLNHLREFTDRVDVTYSPPAIDLDQTPDRKQLNNMEMLEVPYPASQDIRNALPLIPGVLQDAGGNLHFNGGASDQANITLDGFTVTDPVTGVFDARLNIETVQTVDLESGRYSADRGRGSSGSLDLKTAMGDDRWRFGATNFIPGFSTERGFMIDKWSPRTKVSGPIAKGRAWFHNGFDAYYDVNTVHELPPGEDRSRSITSSDLTRVQVNLTPANILTGSFLINYIHRDRYGLSFLEPVETTVNRRQNLYMSAIKDQIYFGRGALVEIGFADTRTTAQETPQGPATFEILPDGKRGNYFAGYHRDTYRQQWTGSAYLPGFQLRGTHQLRFGFDVQRSNFDQTTSRHDYRVWRNDMTLARYVSFSGNQYRSKSNFEAALYVSDRWSPVVGLLVEAGLRSDWDQITRQPLISPRVAVAWAPRWFRETKIAAGYGIFNDALNLNTITLHQDQDSYSTFYDRAGRPASGPVATSFLVDEHELKVPHYRTLSLSAERKLPFDFYGRASYIRRVGVEGFTFENVTGAGGGPPVQGFSYLLRNQKNDRYDAVEITVRRTFKGQFEWLASYVRSSTRTDAVVEYSLENPIFAPQGPGPYSWDAPNRFLSWGWAPVSKSILPGPLRFLVGETTVAYLAEYHTGFPFSVVNEEGRMVGQPNDSRLPAYFAINLHCERKFRFLHYLWAWRFGVNNITNSGNPNVVNNNIDSPNFLTYGRGQRRAFNVRLRFLGKK